jgi:ectoine hydrolase
VGVFSREEFLRRISATKQRMAAAGVDVLLVSSPENINYLTGYAGWSFYVPQLLALAHDATEPVFVTRQMDVACADFTAFLDRSNVLGYPESYVGTTERHPMQFIAQTLRDRSWSKGAIGVEKSAHFFSVKSYEILRESLPESRFVDADLLVDWVRAVKSDAEIEVMRQAGAIADATMAGAVDAIAAGVRQCDAAAALYHAQLKGTPEYGGGVPNSVLMPAGEKARAPHLKWTDEPYRAGQAVNIELSGCRHQYHCGLARTVFLGKAPPKLLELATVVGDGVAAALDAVRPGIRGEEVAAAWHAVISRAGYDKLSRIGYSIGLCFQPTWLERTMSLQKGEKTPLATNMTFHLMCGMWGGEHNLVMSETFRVAERGAELLTHYPRHLIEKAA